MTQQILRIREVQKRTGLSRTTIWRQVRAGKFPAPLQLTEFSIGWRAEDIDEWQASRQPVTYGTGAEPAAA